MPSRNRIPPRVRHDERPLSARGVCQPSLGMADPPDKAWLAFQAYHMRNPHIFAAFRDYAVQLYNSGIRRFGAKCIIEHLRFETAVRAHGDVFSLNNSYTSFYARLLMNQDPNRFAGFFEVRKRQPVKGRRV